MVCPLRADALALGEKSTHRKTSTQHRTAKHSQRRIDTETKSGTPRNKVTRKGEHTKRLAKQAINGHPSLWSLCRRTRCFFSRGINIASSTRIERNANMLHFFDTFENAATALQNANISSVKQTCERASIGTGRDAETLRRLGQDNEMSKLNERFKKLEKEENTNLANKQAKDTKVDQD
jgi:hypothetical protein